MSGPRRIALAALIAMGCAASHGADAHPHILVDARAKLLFDQHGDLTAIDNAWSFDEAFSAYAIQGYDSKGDGAPTRQDLQPLAEINMSALQEYHFFTRVSINGALAALRAPTDDWDEFAGERLTLHFTIPLKQPLAVAGHTIVIDVYDDEYFAAVSFPMDQPLTFSGEPMGCRNFIERPQALDAATAGQLAKIPVSQRELPADLHAVTNKLVNAIVIRCPSAENAK